eukprot:TRINITY_DN6439_c0_g1_i1.p1 TRINITY_DN6439_c0_g1~~TRINITY_DN6439_c0_g1_i1.p1  ORF type:complete len:257 (+),score=36.94 TRINITY_DN6439_c0_g1_i1:165-935(+)
MSTTTSAAPLRPKFVLFGDSITQQSFRPGGWGAALSDRYARKADVILRGYSGYNTRWALYLLDRVFPCDSHDAPALVTIFFGANDASLPDSGSSRQHVPISEYESNLRAIINHIHKASTSTRVILIAPPPVDEESRLLHQKITYGDKATGIVERTNEAAGQYAEACKSVGREMGVPVLDMWQLVQEIPDWATRCLSDGLHLTAQGNEVVFEGLLHIIQSDMGLPSLVSDDLPWDFPEHSDIDSDDPKLTFAPAEAS